MQITVHMRTNATSALERPIPKDRDARAARVPYDAAKYVLVVGACPECRASNDAEFEVVGGAIRHQSDREMVGDAVCRHCNEHIGAIVVVYDTIFGAEEDQRVTAGRYRVY